MSTLNLEQQDWLERNGVKNLYLYEFLRQTPTHVYLKRTDIGLIISRKKDIVGWVF